MFCKWCGKVAFVRGGPIAAQGCPVCEWSFFGGQEKVSRDDDPPGDGRSSSDDADSSSEYSASSDDASYSSDNNSDSLSDYSTSGGSTSTDSSSSILIVVIVIVSIIFAALSTRDRQPATSDRQPATSDRQPTTPADVKKCSQTIVDGLAPGQTVVVVGCSGSGIEVLDRDRRLLYRWDACSACGGFFGSFAGVRTINGQMALMVKMVDGPRMDGGGRAEPTIALHFDGKQFQFADHFEDNADAVHDK